MRQILAHLLRQGEKMLLGGSTVLSIRDAMGDLQTRNALEGNGGQFVH